MIPSAKDYLSMWYENWKADLEKNLAQQAALRVDEQTLRELVGTCEQAFGLLFPEPPAPDPVPDPEPTPEPVNESPTPDPNLGNPESGSVEGLAGPG